MRIANQTSANTRIQWLHKKIVNMYYPNAMRLAERFNISHRQAQRDVDYLKKELLRRIELNDSHHSGLIYGYITVEFTELPDPQCIDIRLVPSESDELFSRHKAEPV